MTIVAALKAAAELAASSPVGSTSIVVIEAGIRVRCEIPTHGGDRFWRAQELVPWAKLAAGPEHLSTAVGYVIGQASARAEAEKGGPR